ncbi:hypothetical protein ACXGQW_10540 [Wenyingzhuangia sp. IMCC45533]
MLLKISRWTSHYNQFLYSILFYSEKEKFKFRIIYSSEVPNTAIVIEYLNKNTFLDYSDDTKFIDRPEKYHYYFKRSLLFKDLKNNVRPLNFQVNFTYKPFKLLTKIPFKILNKSNSRTELVRCLDWFNILTKDSHHAKKVKNIWRDEIEDYGGRVIFMTRLWNPDKTNNSEEKSRREIQNNFRINACRIISKNFPNSVVGIYPDDLAKKMAPDVLLEINQTKKKNYISELEKADICLANDGLKNTPGWKIGEYAMMNKAIISTPLNIVVDEFKECENYIGLQNNVNYSSLPDVINNLIKDKKYLELKTNNKKWSSKYIKPDNYIRRIIDIIEE